LWIQCVSRMDLLSLIKLPIYGLYNWRLTNQLRDRPLPQHVIDEVIDDHKVAMLSDEASGHVQARC